MKFCLELRFCSLFFAIILTVTTASENSLIPEKCMPPAIFFDNGVVKHCAIRKNEYALLGETVKIPCGNSMRPAWLEWYRNGQKINLNDRITQDDNSKFLRIENLEFEDNGVYTCLEWFGKLYQVHSLSLEVQSLPYFTFTQENISVVKGHSTNLKCQVNGEPKPMVKWLKNNKGVNYIRYEISESRDLQIRSIMYRDAGEYTCVATNIHGSVNVTTHLMVKNPTEITNVEGDYELIVDDTAKFKCNVVADPSLKLRIDWLKNEEVIDIESEPRIFLNADGSLITIMKINELDAGTYTCVASTELDNAKAQATLVVHGWPKPPTLLGVDCGDKKIRISWNATSDDHWPITHYTIEYKTGITPNSWEIIKDHIPFSDQSYTVQFIPWIYNSFRVIAWNKLGASQPSSHSSTCTSTLEDVPYKNPDNVEVKEVWKPFHHLKVKWTAMPPIEHLSLFRFMYRVYYKRDIPGENWRVVDIDDWTKNEFEIETDDTYQRYKIKVTASNEKGECKELPREIAYFSGSDNPQRIVGSIDEDVPLQAPGNFTLEQVLDETTVLVSWEDVYDEAVRRDLLGYSIEIWTDINDKKTVGPINAEGISKKTAKIENIFPRIKNYARISAYDDRGSGPPSEIITIDTSKGPAGPVIGLRVNAVGSTAIMLEWSRPIPFTNHLWGYNITFQKINDSIVERKMEQLPFLGPKVTSARLLGLSPQTSYRITIRPDTKDGDGQPSSVQIITRAPKRPGKPTFTLDKIPKKNGLVDLKVVRHVKEDDLLESYFFVEYKMLEEYKRKKTHLERKTNEIIIPSCKQGRNYVVYAIAVDGEYFVESDPLEIIV